MRLLNTIENFNHPIFQELSPEDREVIRPYFELISLNDGECLITEGDVISKELFLIVSGSVNVVKSTHVADGSLTNPSEFVIATLGAGELIGELSFFKDAPRAATIRCSAPTTLLSLTPIHLNEMRMTFPLQTSLFFESLLRHISERVRISGDKQVESLTTQLEISERNARGNIFFSYVIGILCVYNLAIHQISKWSTDTAMASVVSALIIFVFMGVMLLIIRQSKLPFSMFGLTMKGGLRSLKESMGWTVVIMGLMLLMKWILITYVSSFKGQPLIHFQFFEQQYLAFNFIVYGLHSPIQEFITRGVLQGSLQHFLVGKRVVLRAILISNALFAATHVHLFGGAMALVVFVPGLFWGWLYARNQTLIGVSISHILIGWWGLFILSF